MTRLLKINVFCRGASMLFYPAALPLSRQTLTYVWAAQQLAEPPVGGAPGAPPGIDPPGLPAPWAAAPEPGAGAGAGAAKRLGLGAAADLGVVSAP